MQEGGGLDHLKSVQDLLSGYLGNEEIGAKGHPRYIDQNGRVRQVEEDFISRKDRSSPEIRQAIQAVYQRIDQMRESLERDLRSAGTRLNQVPVDGPEEEAIWAEREAIEAKLKKNQTRARSIGEYLERKTHAISGRTLEGYKSYQNPYLGEDWISGKDLHVARRRIAPRSPEKLRCVLIGDIEDAVDSDPETPLVTVSERVRLGEWNLVSSVVDQLFSSAAAPHEQFERMIQGRNEGQWTSAQGDSYTLKRSDCQERIIRCP